MKWFRKKKPAPQYDVLDEVRALLGNGQLPKQAIYSIDIIATNTTDATSGTVIW